MNESFEKTGFWWYSDTPDKKMYGTLTFKPSEGGVLDLTIPDSSLDESEVFLRNKIIYGETRDGQSFSLIDCICTPGGWVPSGIAKRKIYVLLIVKGTHIPFDDECKIQRAFSNFAILNRWIGISGLKVSHGKKVGIFDVKYRPQRALVIKPNADLKVSLYSGVDVLSRGRSELNLKEIVNLEIETRIPQPYSTYKILFRTIQDFFTIACHTPAMPVTISVQLKDGQQEPNQLLFKTPYYSESTAHPRFDDFLFGFHDVKNNLRKILSNWIRKAEKLHLIRDLYLAGLHQSEEFLTSKFLLFAQAVEVYHRVFREEGYIDEASYKKHVLENLRSALPVDAPIKMKAKHKQKWRDFRSSFEGKLGHLYQYSLSKRLKLLAKEFGKAIDHFIPNAKGMMQEIAEYRNYFTHFGDDRIKNALEADKLLKYTEVLKLMLELCFLKEMGIDGDELYRLVSRNLDYQFKIGASKPIANFGEATQKSSAPKERNAKAKGNALETSNP